VTREPELAPPAAGPRTHQLICADLTRERTRHQFRLEKLLETR
jgi:hypothetical protein